MLLPVHPWVPSKKVSLFGPAVWPAIGNINMNVLLYCIDYLEDLTVHFFGVTLFYIHFYFITGILFPISSICLCSELLIIYIKNKIYKHEK